MSDPDGIYPGGVWHATATGRPAHVTIVEPGRIGFVRTQLGTTQFLSRRKFLASHRKATKEKPHG